MKKSQIDKLTEELEREIAVLQAALDRIRKQPQPTPRKPRSKPVSQPRLVSEG